MFNGTDAPAALMSVPERRRSPRAIVGPRLLVTVPATWSIRLLDVSLGGLAFASPYGLDVGRTVALRATFGRDAFNGHIRGCWSRIVGADGLMRQFEIGAVFLPLDEGSRRALESFLKLSPSL